MFQLKRRRLKALVGKQLEKNLERRLENGSARIKIQVKLTQDKTLAV